MYEPFAITTMFFSFSVFFAFKPALSIYERAYFCDMGPVKTIYKRPKRHPRHQTTEQ